MTDHPPSPVMAAVGLVATAADGLRQLPHVLESAGQAAVRRYDEFALRGQEVLAGHPHLGGRAEQAAPTGPTSAAGPPTAAGPATGPATPGGPVTVGGPAEVGEPWAVSEPPGAVEPEVATEPPGGVEPEVASEPPGAVEPEVATAPPIGRTEPVVLPEEVLDEVAQMTPGADLAHHELPLTDFDHQTVPQLRGRLRSLGLAELVQLRDYEQAHAARLPVLTLLDNRIAKILEDTDQ